MPPRPVDDVRFDFPALCDKIAAVLCAIWTFLCDVCIAVWSALCDASWAVWTWPPFEAFRNEFVAALIALEAYAVEHPLTTVALVVLVYVVIPGTLNTLRMTVRHCLGFGRQGALRGSYAANYQSTSYGGNVPRGSTFVRYQPQGAQSGNGHRGVGGASPSWD